MVLDNRGVRSCITEVCRVRIILDADTNEQKTAYASKCVVATGAKSTDCHGLSRCNGKSDPSMRSGRGGLEIQPLVVVSIQFSSPSDLLSTTSPLSYAFAVFQTLEREQVCPKNHIDTPTQHVHTTPDVTQSGQGRIGHHYPPASA